jgi:hypothetical protein
MLETMSGNFAEAEEQENKAVAEFAALKDAKVSEIKAGRKLLEDKEGQ